MSRDLVIVRSGKTSLHSSFVSDNNRQWDLLCCPYVEAQQNAADQALWTTSDVIPGQKWLGLKTLLSSWDGWKKYDYIMLADDDLFSCQRNISDFFAHCHALDAKLAQPSLLAQSHFTHLITVENKNFIHRRTSFVEIMMPCFRRDILEKLLPTFDLGSTGCGWGLDNVWPKLLNFDSLYIVDDTPLLHTRPLTSERDKEAQKILLAELEHVTSLYGAQKNYIKNFSGMSRARFTIKETEPNFLGLLMAGYGDLIARTPEYVMQTLNRQFMDFGK